MSKRKKITSSIKLYTSNPFLCALMKKQQKKKKKKKEKRKGGRNPNNHDLSCNGILKRKERFPTLSLHRTTTVSSKRMVLALNNTRKLICHLTKKPTQCFDGYSLEEKFEFCCYLVALCSPDGDTDFFDIVTGVLQGDILAPYLFII